MALTTSPGVVSATFMRRDVLAVAQHGDAVAIVEDLRHAVGDVDDRDALRRQLAHDLEQDLRLALGQRGGRLVEDQHAAVQRQRLGDLDQLLLRDGERAHQRGGIDVAEAAQDLAGAALEPAIVHQQRAAGVGRGHEDVLGDRDIGAERDLLVDEADAERCAMAGEVIATGLPSRRISPLSGRRMPSMMFISVDLPAPFSPASAWISPLRSSKSTPRSARTGPKDLVRLGDLEDQVVVGAGRHRFVFHAWMWLAMPAPRGGGAGIVVRSAALSSDRVLPCTCSGRRSRRCPW